MSTLRISLAIAALLSIGVPARLAVGQIVTGASSGKHPTLFIEPDAFNPDFQFFAPAEVTDYETGADRDPNKGFFFTFERLYINVTRPETDSAPPLGINPPVDTPFRSANIRETQSPWEGDFTWGNRIELGYMDCEDKGWSLVGWHIDGPNQENTFQQIDILAFYSIDKPPPGLQSDDFAVNDIRATFPIQLTESVNVAKFGSIELNRLFERHYFHNGGAVEPFIGFRYAKFEDFYNRTDYTRASLSPLGGVVDDTDIKESERNVHENNLLGGQLGFRTFKESGHWKLSAEGRAFAFANFQYYTTTSERFVYTADSGPAPTQFPPFYRLEQRVTNHANNDEFVWGGELKADAAYQLTKYISFRVGANFIDLGQGISRGRFFNNHTQDVQMAGVSFGIDINR